MNKALIGMLLAMYLTFALGMLVYEGLFAYSFKRKPQFIARVVIAALFVGGVATGMAFGFYGLVHGILDTSVVWQVDLVRAAAYIIFVAMGIGALAFCFEEKPTLILFAAVAASASFTISSTLYSIISDVFKLTTIYFTMYRGYDVWSFVAFYLTHIVVIILVWLLFARPFARAQKDFGKHINKFVLGIYVMYAFFTAGVSGSQFFNMTLMGIDSVAIPVIFNGFSVFFAVFVLFVQRFNLFWIKDVQQQEAAQSFHVHYKERVDKQQANMELIEAKINQLKHQLNAVLKDSVDAEMLDELQKAVSLFDNGIQTGNEALDLLLTQKSIDLKHRNIRTSAMVEGKALGFMDVADINVFFGNAIDNAMEYLEKLDEEKRFLRISTYRHRSLLYVRVENYCEEEIEFGGDALPRKHNEALPSYGTQSIKSIAVKYGGTVKFERFGDLFVLNALFDCKENF